MTALTSTQRSRIAWAVATVLVVGFAALVVCLRGAAVTVSDDATNHAVAP